MRVSRFYDDGMSGGYRGVGEMDGAWDVGLGWGGVGWDWVGVGWGGVGLVWGVGDVRWGRSKEMFYKICRVCCARHDHRRNAV